MDIILLEPIPKLGRMGQVVQVRSGYARNYLLPQKKALMATKENLAYFETHRSHLEAINLNQLNDATFIAQKIEGLHLILLRQGSERRNLYGSVTARDVVESAKQAGFTIDRRQLDMKSPIKTCGLFPIPLSLHPEVEVTILVNVARSENEARSQFEQYEKTLLPVDQPEVPQQKTDEQESDQQTSNVSKASELKTTERKETERKETGLKDAERKTTKLRDAERKTTKPKDTERKTTKPKETGLKDAERKTTKLRDAERKTTKPKDTERKTTKPKETGLKDAERKTTKPKETGLKDAERKTTKPKETGLKDAERKTTKPKDAEQKTTELKGTERKGN